MDCKSIGCANEAGYEIMWPGHDSPTPLCNDHAERAVRLAKHMGFVLPIKEINEGIRDSEHPDGSNKD